MDNPHVLQGLSSLDEVRIHLIEVTTGRITDRLKYSNDYILLSNHTGVAMNGRRLGILSLQKQSFRVYYIDDAGRFIPDGIIGAALYEDDVRHLRNGNESTGLLLGIRQRLFSFLYRRALTLPNPTLAVRLVYNNWELLEGLCMSRVQFLDRNHVLIKLTCPESLSVRSRASSDNGLQSTAFYIVYSLLDTQIKSFHRSTSTELYEAVRDYHDFVRIISTVDETADDGVGINWQTCAANDVYERQLWERNVQLLAASKPSQGEIYAAKRLLTYLPIAPQTHSESPYLDSGIFRFDERSVSAADRQRSASDFPVRFFSRRSDRVRFKLNSGTCPETAPPSSNPYRVK
jgi:hypothetical protein